MGNFEVHGGMRWIALFAPRLGREWDILNVSCLGSDLWWQEYNEERTSAPHLRKPLFRLNPGLHA